MCMTESLYCTAEINTTFKINYTSIKNVFKEVGGGIGMGNTCPSMADSCQCMTKTTTIL